MGSPSSCVKSVVIRIMKRNAAPSTTNRDWGLSVNLHTSDRKPLNYHTDSRGCRHKLQPVFDRAPPDSQTLWKLAYLSLYNG